MKQQAIVFTAPGRAELVEKPIPVPCPGQVVVQTAISTISSGTERANLVGEVNVGIYSYDTVAVFPRQSGYSSSGIVTAVGPGVTSVQVGDRVAIEVTGVGAGLDGALDCMAPMGRVALLGCTRHSDFSIDYYHKVHGPGISLIGAHTMARPGTDSSSGLWTTRDDVGAIAALVAGERLEFGSMVQEVHSPAEAPQVYGRLAAGNAFSLIQFDWSRLS